MPEEPPAHLIEELKTIEENCLYTGQAHFVIASRKGAAVQRVFVIASAAAGIAGALVAAGLPAWIGIVSAVAGAVGAVAGALGADEDVHSHRVAANVLTRLRHEARALRETFWNGMDPAELTREVRRLSEYYNGLIQGLPPTDDEAMAKATEQIRSGRFVPDFRVSQGGAGGPPTVR